MNIESILINLCNVLIEPKTGLTAKEMNLKCTVEELSDHFKLRFYSGFPIKLLKSYKSLFIDELHKHFPNINFQLELVQDIKPHKTQLVGKGLRNIKNTIAVASGKGGVGKSTVAVNLAIALAQQGARVGLLDADIYGPSVPMMLGDASKVETKGDFYLPVQKHGIQAMSIGYLSNPQEALIWRGPMLAKSLIQMLDITHWDNLDYLFIDLPPGTGDIQLSLVQKIPLSGAIIVTTPQNVATLDAQKAIAMFQRTNIDVLGVIENMSTHVCGNCGHEESIFGTGGAKLLCKNYNCRLLGQLPLDGLIRETGDNGQSLLSVKNQYLKQLMDAMAFELSVQIARKPLNYADKFPPIVVK